MFLWRWFLPLATIILLVQAATASPHPHPHAAPNPSPALPKLPIADPVINLLALPPPKILRTTKKSPECANINQGEYQCCRAMFAGDQQVVVWLAKIYGYNLNPNDINGLNCDDNIAQCPGVKVCCQVTTLAPLLSMWCQDA